MDGSRLSAGRRFNRAEIGPAFVVPHSQLVSRDGGVGGRNDQTIRSVPNVPRGRGSSMQYARGSCIVRSPFKRYVALRPIPRCCRRNMGGTRSAYYAEVRPSSWIGSGVILLTLLSYWISEWHPPDEASLLSNFWLSW
jgi:hypothetical protein